ncbi:MAG: hypothetical protein HZB42_03395 [Sphingobacteriales bacterium]|nr:hypothetical protein [Sphingobacteriales bacterium]
MQTKIKKLNAAWHKKHPMPKNPTVQQRVEWHLSHLKNCNCHPVLPEKLKDEMKKLKIRIPKGC